MRRLKLLLRCPLELALSAPLHVIHCCATLACGAAMGCGAVVHTPSCISLASGLAVHCCRSAVILLASWCIANATKYSWVASNVTGLPLLTRGKFVVSPGAASDKHSFKALLVACFCSLGTACGLQAACARVVKSLEGFSKHAPARMSFSHQVDVLRTKTRLGPLAVLVVLWCLCHTCFIVWSGMKG